MAHGVGGLFLVSEALRSWVFDLLRRDSKHSKRKSRTDFHLLFVGFTHTHSSPFRNASAPVSVLCSKLEDVDVNILLAGRLSSSTGHTVGVILLGRCAGLGGV